MNKHLKNIGSIIQLHDSLSAEQKNEILKSLKDAAKEFEIAAFKLDETEKVKQTIAILLEETIEELEQKRKAVEVQNRELEIESSLERIRTSAMGMNKPEDLLRICENIFAELKMLGFNDLRNSLIHTFNDEDDYFLDYDYSDYTGGSISRIPCKGLPMIENFLNEIRKARDSFAEIIVTGTELELWKKFRKETGQLEDSRIDSAHVLYYYYYSIGVGDLGISTFTPILADQRELLKRFRNVFDFAYQRYMDVTKAEAQAREATIEASLEKVRGQAMAMHHTDELSEVLSVLFGQFDALGICPSFAMLSLVDVERNTFTFHCTGKAGKRVIAQQVVDMNSHDLWKAGAEKWKNAEPDLVQCLEYPKEMLPMLFDIFSPLLSEMPEEARVYPKDFPDGLYTTEGYCKFGYLGFSNTRRETEEEKNIVLRFATEFGRVYQRFLDLQKAEAQTREAQIEAALERVRSRTMAMHRSQDVDITVTTLFDELLKLGVDRSVRSGIGILNQSRKMEVWTASSNQTGQTSLDKGILDMGLHPLLTEVQDAWEAKKETHIYELAGDDLKQYYRAINDAPEYSLQVDFEKLPGKITHYDFFFPEGVLFAFSPTPFFDEVARVYMRFASVFGQTYRRYLDLQQAEAQARDAIKQTSLDRVRGVIASMRSAADLELITPLIFKELTILGVPFIRCGVFIIHENQEMVEAYLSSPEGHSLGVLRLPYHSSDLTYHTVDAWRKDLIYRQHWNKDDFVNWINLMMEQDQIQNRTTYQGAVSPPESLDLHFVPFTQGMLYVGAISPLIEKEIELVQALAKAFSIAYARYEDFVKLELAKADIESTLSELKSTQTQLIQQEKLASLGQLTAGIAHEIKNPLNFVNNFSEVSIELIDEVRKELDSLKTQHAASPKDQGEVLDEVNGILSDIQNNLQKIHEHGSRANSIVTSMLQHSRGGSGKMEPTDLNALIKEYVNLCFHGMRAGKNPINVEIALDLDREIPEVPLIKEDFTRVIINLCNNAFDAMRDKSEKAKVKSEKYFPQLTICSKADNGKVLIEIEDNGPGIPDEIKDKILQPFFTTKKGTEGTGLGLSITHDIVKAHGGELKMESKEGEGSGFIIKLPIA